MKRVFIIHGWSGYPDEGWFPWLKKELEKKGFGVKIPSMPHPENPTIEDWVTYLSKIVGKPDKNTFFVGHSIGCQTILRYLQSLNHPNQVFDAKNNEVPPKEVGGAIFVAGWFNLENLEDSEEKKTAAPWVTTPIDFVKVKRALPKSTLIISDDDPYGALEENKEKFSELGSKIVVLHKAGHINGEGGFTQLPEALIEFETLK